MYFHTASLFGGLASVGLSNFGKLVDATHNFNFPLYVIAGFLLTGGLVWLSVDQRKKVGAQPGEPATVPG